jgi:DNA invertase Pin-like site-specific DNA recombinase
MQSVIGYLRVSTKSKADKGISLLDQKLQIQEFAKHNSLKIRQVYIDVDSARNEADVSKRPQFNNAVERSLKTKWPIIAASADRFTRTGAAYDRFVAAGGRAYGAREGFRANRSSMPAAIARSEREANRISRNTRSDQALAKVNGVQFGNPQLVKARAASMVARKANARKCREEFRAQFFDAKNAGAETDEEIAFYLNGNKRLSPQGRFWTRANVTRMRRELEAAGSRDPLRLVASEGTLNEQRHAASRGPAACDHPDDRH